MTILVALDLSEPAERVLDAVKRVAPAGAEIYVVHVVEPDPEFVGWKTGPGVVRDQIAEGFRRERHAVEGWAATLSAAGFDAHGLTVQGPTVETVLQEAERLEAGLIVVGSHGHGAAYDLAIGSVSAGVIRKAKVPVLVVPVR